MMETMEKSKRSAGWQDEETRRLFEAVREAGESGVPLRSVFESLSEGLGRKPNSIRNHYYACLRENPEAAGDRPVTIRMFTPEETHELLRQVLMGRGQGMSVRACVMRLAEGDRSRMLRYQNKYRALLKRQPELIDAVREELEAEGLPCPETDVIDCADAGFCDPADPAAAALMAEPCVAAMLEGLKELMHRAARAGEADARLKELDRLRVQNDLHRLSWEKDFSQVVEQLDGCLMLLREFLALDEEERYMRLSAFCVKAMDCVTCGENLLSRAR